MSTNRPPPPRLNVTTQGNRHFILVAPEWAGDLRIYLRTIGITSTFPEPVSTGVHSIELDKKANTVVVQEHLDHWDKCA